MDTPEVIAKQLTASEENARIAKHMLEPSELVPHERIALIASLCHEMNRVYSKAIGQEEQPAWPDAPDEMRLSAIKGVRRVLDTPEVTALELHEAWMSEKLRDGWRYAQTKSYTEKTHPCLLPYRDLPMEEKRKDYLFRAVVNIMVLDDKDPRVQEAVYRRLQAIAGGAR